MACSSPAFSRDDIVVSFSPDAALQYSLDALQAKRPDVPGFAIAVIDGERLVTAASGVAAPDGMLMTAQTPFRLASVTKTFVAAAVLRLYEQGQVDLDAPISGLISAEHAQLLEADGYDTGKITVRHLLMHASGLDDHFGTDESKALVFANPLKQWTRTEQIRLLVDATDPLGQPGERFHYSDTGYVLLGEIIETVTGMRLGEAVRTLNRFDAIGIAAMRWEPLAGEEQGAARAHQWIDGIDTFALDGSLDAYGGGGLIGNVIDTARYYDALFDGRIFASAETLQLMQQAPSHPEGSPYRLGLFAGRIGNHQVYMHGGFWGVHALHVPSLDLTIVAVALDQSGHKDIRQLAADLVGAR
ncbi:MAG: serine hydrolase domain-containing protein [Pseudomonadota bacterium]